MYVMITVCAEAEDVRQLTVQVTAAAAAAAGLCMAAAASGGQMPRAG